MTPLRETFLVFLKLGCTCFGGPAAHLGYFRRELVQQRRWISETTFTGFIALSQLLPGPSSSQIGFLVGISRGGIAGGAAAWLGFTLPSAILMMLFAAGIGYARAPLAVAALHGLEIAAVAVIANAVITMFRSLCPDWLRRAVAVAAAVILYFNTTPPVELATLLAGALIGWLFIRSSSSLDANDDPLPVSPRAASLCFALFLTLLIALELGARLSHSSIVQMPAAFYRTGSLVFGGGHVVLPLLNEAVVSPGWVNEGDFLAGYGAAQTIPGPLFTFAAYLGFVAATPLHGSLGAVACLLCIFLPGLLLAAAAAPLWSRMRSYQPALFAISGVNAVVVGLLLSALVHAGSTVLLGSAWACTVAIAALGALFFTRVSPVLIVFFVAVFWIILSATLTH